MGEAVAERLVQYTAIDEFTRLRYLKAYKEQSTHSSKDFLLSLIPYFLKRGIEVHCIQTDNGLEFTNRLISHQTHRLTAFELAAQALGIKLKYIRPYTPRHNGKVERSHREDQKRFYSHRRFYSFEDWGCRNSDGPWSFICPYTKLTVFVFLSKHASNDHFLGSLNTTCHFFETNQEGVVSKYSLFSRLSGIQ